MKTKNTTENKTNIKTESDVQVETETKTETDDNIEIQAKNVETKIRRKRRKKKKKKKVKKPVLANLRRKKMNTRRRRVVALYRQGLSSNKIAMKLQVNPQTVRSDLHAMGKRTRIQKTKIKRNAALISDRCSGKTIGELSRKYKISEDRVKELIHNYNKTAETPVPDFRELRNIRLSKQKPKGKQKRKRTSSKKITPSTETKTLSFREKRANFLAKRLKRMIAMQKSGSPVKAIAQQFELSTNRVYQLLHKAKQQDAKK